MRLHYTADYVFANGAFLQPGWLVVEGDTIVSVSPGRPPKDAQQVVDFGVDAIFPGTVNTHTHSYLTLLRGRYDDLEFSDWLPKVYATMASFGPEETYLGAALCFGELLSSGTTSVADFFYLNSRGNDNVRAAIQAALDLGIRLVMGRTFLDAEWGGPAAREPVDVAVGRYRELRSEFADHPLVQVCPAPHSIYGASRGMIEAAFHLAEEYGTRWHMHVADSEDTTRGVETTFGAPSAQLLEDWGVLTDRLVAVHGLWFSDEEVELLSRRHVGISYNAAVQMKDAILDVPRLLRHGITVGLGTDHATSNNSQNILSDLRVAWLAQRSRARSAAVLSVGQLIDLATVDGGRLLGLPVGRLAAGYKADFMVVDTQDLSLQPLDSLASNIVHAISDRAVRHVFCGGRQVLRDGRLALVNQHDLVERIAALSTRLAPVN